VIENRIKEFRELKKLSQVELARKAKMASTNLNAIENGRLAPWPKVKKRLAKVLGVTESELFPMDEGRQYESK